MKIHPITASILLSAITSFCVSARAQSEAPVMSTPPASLDEKEAMYNATVADRTLKIMQALALNDSAKSNQVYQAIFSHYHALRARDEAIDDELGNMPKGSAEWRAERIKMYPTMSKPLHERFIATLSKYLTPAQIDEIKDKMTYGKVEFTYNGYCSIVPGLTDQDKAKIMELLKQARDVAMDGGSSTEKTAIFQQYKDQINDYLQAQGIDVAKAIQDWNEKQKLVQKTSEQTMPGGAMPEK